MGWYCFPHVWLMSLFLGARKWSCFTKFQSRNTWQPKQSHCGDRQWHSLSLVDNAKCLASYAMLCHVMPCYATEHTRTIFSGKRCPGTRSKASSEATMGKRFGRRYGDALESPRNVLRLQPAHEPICCDHVAITTTSKIIIIIIIMTIMILISSFWGPTHP